MAEIDDSMADISGCMYSQNNVWIKSKQFHFGLKATQRRLQLFYQSERLSYILGYVSSVAARQKDLFHVTPQTRVLIQFASGEDSNITLDNPTGEWLIIYGTQDVVQMWKDQIDEAIRVRASLGTLFANIWAPDDRGATTTFCSLCEVMVNKADDNPKILFTPYAWVPGCLPYYNASLPTHFVVLALPYATSLNVVGKNNAYTKFFAQYPKQPRLLVIYDAIDDIPADDVMTAATRKALEPQLEEIQKQFLGVFSWLVQPNASQIKKLRAIFDEWHYSTKYEALPDPGKETQFEKQVQVLK
jgi:hypothetical protein